LLSRLNRSGLMIRTANGNLEVVVLFGTELRHFWRENGSGSRV